MAVFDVANDTITIRRINMPSYDTARDIFSRACPTAVFRPQAPTDWQGDLPLPNAVVEYYTELGPVDVRVAAAGNPYFLPSLSRLWTSQAGYRYDPKTNERFPEWDNDWLVMADEGGDAFILSLASGTILLAYHGEGSWEPKLVFESLCEMATSFAIIGEIVASAGRALTDADAQILSCYREAALKRIAEFSGSPERARKIVSDLGWG